MKQKFSVSPHEMVKSFWRNRYLIGSLAYREVVGRYKGSMFGIFWSMLTPILLLAAYTFVFSVVFKARWNMGTESKTEFAMVLFAGLLVFNLFAECVNRAPGLILNNVSYVKKVVFPLEVLPWVVMSGAIFHFVMSFGVWMIFHLVFLGVPHWTVVLAPFVITPFILFVMGLTWALASFGVYLRDVGQIVGIAVQLLMFMTPLFFPVTAIPEELRIIILFNPMTPSIEMMRDVLYWGHLPNLQLWLSTTIASTAAAAAGFAWFQKTRKGFPDVL